MVNHPRDPLARLHSLVAQVPQDGLPRCLLDVGCGDCACAPALMDALPGWTITGVDLDDEALRRARSRCPTLRLLHANAVNLPDLLRDRFGIILVRHPDVHLHRAAWSRILPMLPGLLAPGGALLITVFAPDEAAWIRALPMPPAYPLDESALAAPGLGGQDRFVLAFRP